MEGSAADNSSSASAPSSTPCGSFEPLVDDSSIHLENEMTNEIVEEQEEQAQIPNYDGTLNETGDKDANHSSKRLKTSSVWMDMEERYQVQGQWKTKCKHCRKVLSISKSGSTSHLKRHLIGCQQKQMNLKQQKFLNLLPSNSSVGTDSKFVCALHDGKLDVMSMREGIANWIVMHEKPFSVVEEEGFNMMLKRGIPQWTSVSRTTIKSDSFKIYEAEKKKLKFILKDLDKISLTTDLWRSNAQRIEYMVLIAHFVNSDWKLQKRVLSFVHIPPPRKGNDISNCIFKCLKEWDIENKVFTISVDNASANDSCIQIMKDTFSKTKRLVCGGKLFHVRCCAHILNIMVQHGLKKIKNIIKNVHDTVDYLNGSEHRLKKFAELVQQYNLKDRRLVLEYKTRWNSTYDMLDCAIKFKEVFFRLNLEDREYVCCPTADDWGKIEKVLEILKVFYNTTKTISGSEYPTSNLFLGEVYYIKGMLDKNSESTDDFVRDLVHNMKERFDKYWGECNLLMAIGALLDPRFKMKALEITFPSMFPSDVVRENIHKVRSTLYELYDEYVSLYSSFMDECNERGSDVSNVGVSGDFPALSKLLQEVRSEQVTEVTKSEVDIYFEEGTFNAQGHNFDILGWWKDKSQKFCILSRLAADVLAIPITTVASEATFSAGSRVIDPYRSKLLPETVQMLICTGDWCRSNFGLKRKNKVVEEDVPKEIFIPVP